MAVEFKDYYATLGLKRDCSTADIRKAFRKLARQYHPDVATDKNTAESKFKEINEANEVLSDPEKRKKYDELGADWQKPQPRWSGQDGGHAQDFNFGGTGFSDFFERYFSGASRYGFADEPSGPGPSGTLKRRGGDIEGDILVALQEVMLGSVRPVSLQITNPENGMASTRVFQVRIPPGVTDGKRIRVPGQGEPGTNGAPAGDLFLRVRHAAHPDFHTKGHDLFHILEISPWEAVLGTELTVPTLDGPIRLRVPSCSENDQQLRVRGRGLPKGKSGGRGDFFACISVVLPSETTAAERKLWENLRDHSTFNPRTNSTAR